MYTRQVSLVLFVCCLLGALARPDGGESPPAPGPGLAYGGIPYGSMSGNLAEFFSRQGAPSGRSAHRAFSTAADIDFAPIEQWLR